MSSAGAAGIAERRGEVGLRERGEVEPFEEVGVRFEVDGLVGDGPAEEAFVAGPFGDVAGGGGFGAADLVFDDGLSGDQLLVKACS